MTGSTTSSTSAAITFLPLSIAPLGPEPSRCGPRSAALLLQRSHSVCPASPGGSLRSAPNKLTVPCRLLPHRCNGTGRRAARAQGRHGGRRPKFTQAQRAESSACSPRDGRPRRSPACSRFIARQSAGSTPPLGTTMRERPSSRLLVLDAEGRVLLSGSSTRTAHSRAKLSGRRLAAASIPTRALNRPLAGNYTKRRAWSSRIQARRSPAGPPSSRCRAESW